MAEEIAAAGGGVAAYVLRPGDPGWAYAFVMITERGAACLCCKAQPCEPTAIISLQAAEDATLTLPLPVCGDCCNPQQVLAAIDCVCADLFPQPVRLEIYGGKP